MAIETFSTNEKQLDATHKLHELLRSDIGRFDDESKKHKAIHRTTDIVLTVTTALTTIVAGLGLVLEGHERQLQFAVLALSALGTAITSWAASRRARDLWQHEREVFYALSDILRELEFRCSVKVLDLVEIEEIFTRSGSILGSSTAKWSRILEKKEKPPDTKSPDS